MKTNLANFGPRAFLFHVPNEEHEYLAGHIELLQESAQAMQHVIALGLPRKKIFFDSDLKTAHLGAVFVNAMAIELTAILQKPQGGAK